MGRTHFLCLNKALPNTGLKVSQGPVWDSHLIKSKPKKILFYTSVHAKSLQSCLTLCDPIDCSPPGSSVHGDSPGKNTAMGCHFLFQGIFPIQGLIWVSFIANAAAKLLQSCLTLCDPIDGSPPGSPIPGILQARTLEWVSISFSNAWKWKVKVKLLSHVRLRTTPRTAAYQAPLSMAFSRQEYWSGMPSPSPGPESTES